MLGIIKSFLEAAALYLSLKNKTFLIDAKRKSRKKQQDLINDIKKLRDDHTVSGTLFADELQLQLKEEKEFYENLSATDPKIGGRAEDQN